MSHILLLLINWQCLGVAANDDGISESPHTLKVYHHSCNGHAGPMMGSLTL